MYTKHLSVKKLYPPFVSGGLWRRWCLLLSAGIRHHPPEAFGGANFSYKKKLSNIRHPGTKRTDTVIIYSGLRQKIYGLEKKITKIVDFIVDVHQLCVILLRMIIEQIRKQIETCGKSRYQISKETSIDKAALCRIMQGGSCKVETADILLKYFEFELVQKKRKQEERFQK